MISNIHALFQFSYESLDTESVISLAMVDQMAVDFDTDPPNPSALSQILGDIALCK